MQVCARILRGLKMEVIVGEGVGDFIFFGKSAKGVGLVRAGLPRLPWEGDLGKGKWGFGNGN